MVDRDVSYGLWKRTKNGDDFDNFKRLRNRVTHLINVAKSNYLSSQIASSNSNKDLWHKLKQLNVKSSSVSAAEVTNSADDINEFFGSNFTACDRHLPVFPSQYSDFSFSTIGETDIFFAMNTIKSNAVGMDLIPLRFIKLLLPFIISEIRHVFNLIITSSKYPQSWKAAKIIPIKKKA